MCMNKSDNSWKCHKYVRKPRKIITYIWMVLLRNSNVARWATSLQMLSIIFVQSDILYVNKALRQLKTQLSDAALVVHECCRWFSSTGTLFTQSLLWMGPAPLWPKVFNSFTTKLLITKVLASSDQTAPPFIFKKFSSLKTEFSQFPINYWANVWRYCSTFLGS